MHASSFLFMFALRFLKTTFVNDWPKRFKRFHAVGAADVDEEHMQTKMTP